MKARAGLLTAWLCFLIFSGSLDAQAPGSTRSKILIPSPWQPAGIAEPDSGRRGSWFAPIASAIIPGTGQLLRHEDRGAIYVIAEVFLLQRFIAQWNESRQEENRYRDIALKVARAPFGASLRDTVFEYFEQMGRYSESGAYDTDPETGIGASHR